MYSVLKKEHALKVLLNRIREDFQNIPAQGASNFSAMEVKKLLVLVILPLIYHTRDNTGSSEINSHHPRNQNKSYSLSIFYVLTFGPKI